MSKTPWIRFFPSDWLAGTRGMTAAETGIYITLLMTMYERGGPLPEDNSRLARLCGASNSIFKSTLESLICQGKLERSEGGIWNERVGRELFYTSEKSSVARQSINARWGKKTNKNNGESDTNVLPTNNERITNQKPDTIYIKNNTNVLSKKTKKACRLPDDFQPDFSMAIQEGFTEQEAQRLFSSFKDYWVAKAGKDATKLDWQATWRNWVRSDYNKKFKGQSNARNYSGNQQQQPLGSQVADQIRQLGRARTMGQNGKPFSADFSCAFHAGQGLNEPRAIRNSNADRAGQTIDILSSKH